MADDSLALVPGLSVVEQAIVNKFITDPELSPANVAVELNIPVSGVLEVLKRTEVRKAVGLGFLTERQDRLEAVRNGTVLALWQMATHDIKDMFNEDGTTKHVKDFPPQLRGAIKGYKMGKYGPEFQFESKAQILLELLKHFKREREEDGDKSEGVQVVFYETKEET